MRKSIVFAIAVTLLSLLSCGGERMGEKRTFLALGTVCSLTLPSSSGEADARAAEEEIEKVESTFSRTRSDSELSLLNVRKEMVVSPELFSLLLESIAWADRTEGAFDPAIGDLTDLWAIATDHPRVPDREEIERANTDWKAITLDGEERRVILAPDLTVDLGGIAKGYAADRVRKRLRQRGIDHALINLGGNVLAMGEKAKGIPWKIGLRDPDGEAGDAFVILSLSDKAVVTSGAYERFFVADGRKYHHILDRETGCPAESDIKSVSVIGEEATVCDALSTALFVMGSEKALSFIDAIRGYDAVVMKEDGSVLFSSGFPYPYVFSDTSH